MTVRLARHSTQRTPQGPRNLPAPPKPKPPPPPPPADASRPALRPALRPVVAQQPRLSTLVLGNPNPADRLVPQQLLAGSNPINPVKFALTNGQVVSELTVMGTTVKVPLTPGAATSGATPVVVGNGGKVTISWERRADGFYITSATATGMTGLGTSEIKLSINGNKYPVTFSSSEFRGLGGTFQLNGVFGDTVKVTAIYKFPDGKTLVEIGGGPNGPSMSINVPADFRLGKGKGTFTLKLPSGGNVSGVLSVEQGGFKFTIDGTQGQPIKVIAEVAAKIFGGDFKAALTNQNSEGKPEFSLRYDTPNINDGVGVTARFSQVGGDSRFSLGLGARF